MRQVARVMEVSRSNLIEQSQPEKPTRQVRYNKSDDEWLIPMIRKIADSRPTYGY